MRPASSLILMHMVREYFSHSRTAHLLRWDVLGRSTCQHWHGVDAPHDVNLLRVAGLAIGSAVS